MNPPLKRGLPRVVPVSLPSAPPRYASWRDMLAPIVKGDKGWPAYSVQTGVRVEHQIALDGDFGPLTEAAVRAWQVKRNLTPDGVVGPRTQGSMLRSSENRVHTSLQSLPTGVLTGFAEAEGANLLAATNSYTPPGGTPGVDCGCMQLRVYGPPFSASRLREAFDPYRAMLSAGRSLVARIESYRARNSSLSAMEALKIAVLAHNWPAGADQIVRYGAFREPDRLATWTVKPGGHYTYAEWFDVYTSKILKHVR